MSLADFDFQKFVKLLEKFPPHASLKPTINSKIKFNGVVYETEFNIAIADDAYFAAQVQECILRYFPSYSDKWHEIAGLLQKVITEETRAKLIQKWRNPKKRKKESQTSS